MKSSLQSLAMRGTTRAATGPLGGARPQRARQVGTRQGWGHTAGVGESGPDGQTDLEAMFDYYWRIVAQDYPQPVSQYHFGRWVIDKAWPEYKISVELNGGAGGGYGRPVVCHNCGVKVRAKKADGSPGRELRLPYPSHGGKGAERDAIKSNELQANGWVTLTLTSQQLKVDPEASIQAVIVEIRKAQLRAQTQPVFDPGAAGLSRREIEVLSMIAHGVTYNQIAQQLGVQPSTVKKHIQHIKTKMGVPSHAAACARAVAMGIVKIQVH